MSVINKVLQDLDKRQAAGGGERPAPSNVRTVPGRSAGHEWFWRSVAFLALIALGLVAWVAYQVQPRPIATELAHEAADRAAKRPPPALAQPAAPVVQPAQAPVALKPAAEPQVPATPAVAPAQPEALRFAYSIETPISAPAPKAEAKPAEAPKPPATTAAAAKPRSEKQAAREKPRFERRDVALTPTEKAETEFRRGADLLKRGRAMEAEAAFRSALAVDSGHRDARQALVALKMERGDLAEASRLLRETLAVDPSQADFAVALARIHVERANLLDALAVLDNAAAASDGYGELHVLRGIVLQRLGRHAQAADAYRSALRAQAGTPQVWLGLGISLEALEKRPEAAQAFRNALVSGPVSAEVRTFAEQRIQALR
jgi:MSHA biogenesis protein MshN